MTGKGPNKTSIEIKDQHVDSIHISDEDGNYCVIEGKVCAIDRETTAVLTAVGITTGMTMSCVVPNAGSNNYAENELHLS
eukprot:10935050-Lingulodinium_polyedra.AAC.1